MTARPKLVDVSIAACASICAWVLLLPVAELAQAATPSTTTTEFEENHP